MSHTGFIVGSYVVAALVVLGRVVWVALDRRRQHRRLADLESRGIRRRSAETHGAEGAR